jgi:putative hemolysin
VSPRWIVVVLALLIFGEITPKTLAIRHGERMAQLYALPLELFNLIFKPVAIALTWVASGVASVAGTSDRHRSLSQDEIRTVIMMGEEAGVLRQAETEILRNVLKLEQTEVTEVMMPRINITGVQADEPVTSIGQVIAVRGFTQMPVYEADMDSIIGIVHAKDILLRAASGDTTSTARDAMRPALFVPETKTIVSLLNEMRARRTQMAIIVDEYGGTSGIVTLEDLPPLSPTTSSLSYPSAHSSTSFAAARVLSEALPAGLVYGVAGKGTFVAARMC